MSGAAMLAFTPFDPWHMLVLGLVALLLFGKRLPEVGRSLGKGISEFKKGLRDVQDELNRDDIEDEPPPRRKLRPPVDDEDDEEDERDEPRPRRRETERADSSSDRGD